MKFYTKTIVINVDDIKLGASAVEDDGTDFDKLVTFKPGGLS